MVLDDVFSNYDIEHLYLTIDPNNPSSQRVAQKCGFIPREGNIRYYDISKQEYLRANTVLKNKK